MPEHHQTVESEVPLATIEGLKKEVSTSVVRYFAPIVAIAREFGTTAGIATTWWKGRELEKDRAGKQRPDV
jgi:hypothetical protein